MSMEHGETAFDGIVIGGGAAGLLCAGVAASYGKRICLLERNDRFGKKLAITGKGRCNVTNDCDRETFLNNVVHNPRFLFSAYAGFTPQDVMSFFERLGVPLKVERGNRVFPVSDRASDIVQALKQYAKECGVTLLTDSFVTDILTENGTVIGVRLRNGHFYTASAVVLATGGKSYPLTGSDGSGYKLAQKHGHTLVTPKASLVPLEMQEQDLCRRMQGLSLKNVAVRLIRGEKELYTDFGEMLFTHFGISGPVVLSASSYAGLGDRFSIDLKPALSAEKLDKRILSDFAQYSNKDFRNALADLLPAKMIPVVVERSGIPADLKVHSITKEMRGRLVALLKDFQLTVRGMRPIDEAIVTAGGISVKEINPKTMESLLVRGLYFAGEVMDVDAYTGGFNLQIAFSTAYAAGCAIGAWEGATE